MPASRTVTAAVIVIGNEILSGRTHDANLPYLARSLNTVGIRVMEARVIADDEGAIVSAVNACRAAYDHVFTTGGIGPTHDDITSAAVARAFNVALVRDPQAVSLLTHHYAAADLNEARLKMAEVPEGASLIDNPVSAAPGFRIDNVWVLPGVPRILQAMVDGLTAGLQGVIRCCRGRSRRSPPKAASPLPWRTCNSSTEQLRSAAIRSCAPAASASAWWCALPTPLPSTPPRPR